MRRAIHAEWTKLRSVSSTLWSLLAVVAGTAAVSTLAAMGVGTGDDPDAPRICLSGVYLGQVAVVVLGVLAVAPEYDTAMIRTTLSADPSRGRVLAAKSVVVAALALIAGLVAVLGSLLVGWIILRGNGVHTPSIVDGSVLRAAGGTVLYFGMIGLLSLGAALVVRHTGGAITVVLGLLYTLPVVAQVATDPEWRTWLLRITPMTAGLAIQVTRNVELSPIAPWAGFGVLAGYTIAAVALGAVLLRARDV
jgi:ABC-2 type transport system permease protein